MVVGSGMIASRFELYKNDDSKIIFASGVSNSKNSKQENFERELQMLNDTIKNNSDKTINIANPQNYSVPFIIQKIEEHLHRKAICTMIDKGSDYNIDISAIEPVIKNCNISFADNYLATLLKKYYHSK